MSKQKKWKLSCQNVIDTGHGSIVVNQDCHPDDAMDRDVRDWLHNETLFVLNACNACTGMSDPDKEINALREVAEACEKLRSQWTPQHVATTALDFAVVDVILAIAALKAEGEGKNG